MDLEDSKLVTLLKSLNKQEFERLEKYVKSPFFNSSEQLITLFDLLRNDYPDFTSISKEKIFRLKAKEAVRLLLHFGRDFWECKIPPSFAVSKYVPKKLKAVSCHQSP